VNDYPAEGTTTNPTTDTGTGTEGCSPGGCSPGSCADCAAESAALDGVHVVEVWLRLGNRPSRRVGYVQRETLGISPLLVSDLLLLAVLGDDQRDGRAPA
jgi:hypothetical protein